MNISKFYHDHSELEIIYVLPKRALSEMEIRHQMQTPISDAQKMSWCPVNPRVCLRWNIASQIPAPLQAAGTEDQISAFTPWHTPPHPPTAPAVVLPAGEPEGAVARIAVGGQVVRKPTGHL